MNALDGGDTDGHACMHACIDIGQARLSRPQGSIKGTDIGEDIRQRERSLT